MSTRGATGPATSADHSPSPWVMVPALLIGWGLVLVGVRAALGDSRDAHPLALAVHVVTFDLLHDLVIAPAAMALLWLAGRVLPVVARGPVRFALATSALVGVFAYPLVRRWGERPTNPSALPLPYGRNVAIIIAVIWAMALATVTVRTLRSRAVGRRAAASIPAPDAAR